MEIKDRHNGAVLVRLPSFKREPSLRGVYLGFRVTHDLSAADLRGLDMTGADVTGRDLSDADLTGATLTGTKYDERTVWPAGFDPERHGAVRIPTDWKGVRFNGQDLSGWDFSDHDLRGISLVGAKLDGTNFSRAILRGANVAGTDLSRADLTDAELQGIRADADTRWPDGFDLKTVNAAKKDGPTTMEGLVAFLKALADPNRLRILGLLTGEEATGEELADALNLSEATVSHHLARLKELGLVRVRPDGTRRLHQTDEERLNALLRSLPQQATRIARGTVDPEAFSQKVLNAYFDGERLHSIPLRYKKQRIVLTRVVEAFAWDSRYHEREVNEILKRIHPDFASLRRYLIDHRFMARENNIYWRLPAPPPL